MWCLLWINTQSNPDISSHLNMERNFTCCFKLVPPQANNSNLYVYSLSPCILHENSFHGSKFWYSCKKIINSWYTISTTSTKLILWLFTSCMLQNGRMKCTELEHIHEHWTSKSAGIRSFIYVTYGRRQFLTTGGVATCSTGASYSSSNSP